MSARSIQNGSSLGIPSPRPDSLRTDHGTLKSPPLLIKFGGLAEATAISMPDAESATSALRYPKQLMPLPLPDRPGRGVPRGCAQAQQRPALRLSTP